ncbi:MAG TPA: hypothetical protein DCM10_08285 [Xanthomarina gelatinilytica]|nr:hypothetical protein [Xanthomarina gelatinilytica]|tara:strand:+ start:343 stop:597 length:255 start_codon:yes stop_codon:yes gene_type:complete
MKFNYYDTTKDLIDNNMSRKTYNKICSLINYRKRLRKRKKSIERGLEKLVSKGIVDEKSILQLGKINVYLELNQQKLKELNNFA